MLHLRRFHIPTDFNYYEYINNYSDVENMTINEAYNHYVKIGRLEYRIYNSKKLENFDYGKYRELYPELNNLSDPELILHYIKIGKYKNNLDNIQPTINELEIPKILHFIWVGTNNIPEEYKTYINSWRKYHNNWKIRIWTDNDLTYSNFLNLDKINMSTKMAQKADIMRYEIIYNFGGIYVDCDFEAFKNIEKIISNCNFFTCNGDHDCYDNKVITNAFFGASINNEISKKLKDNINKIDIGKKDVNEETGPFYFGYILNDNFKDKYISIPPRLFFPHTFNEYKNKTNIDQYIYNAYGMHHWGNSWNKPLEYQPYIKPKYILYTSEFPKESYGGVSTVVYNMYISLKNYYDTYVIFNPYSKPNDFSLIHNNEIHYINLMNIIKKIQVSPNDIFISHNCERYNIFKYFNNLTPKCFLVSHGFYDIQTLNDTLSKIKIKREYDIKKIYASNESNLDKYNNIITVNPAFTSILKNKYSEKNIYYIPNCIGDSSIYHIPKENDNISKINYLGKEYEYNLKVLENITSNINPIIKFIYIGRIEEYKNVINLIEAFKSIEKCSLIMIGSNTENIDINHDNIIHIDYLCNDECMKIMKMNDVLINISLTESFPMVILEAGLNKLCCYISDLPGLRTIFEDCCIYSSNHYDQNIIKNDLLNIINNKSMIYEQGNKLYNLVKKNYNTDYYHQYLYQLQLV